MKSKSERRREIVRERAGESKREGGEQRIIER